MVDIMQANKARRMVMKYVERFTSAFSGDDDDDEGTPVKPPPPPRARQAPAGAVPQPAPPVKKSPISLLSLLHDTFSPQPAAAAADGQRDRGASFLPSPGKRGLLSAASSTDDFHNVGLHLSSSSLASSVVDGALNPLVADALNPRSWDADDDRFAGSDRGAHRDASDEDWPSDHLEDPLYVDHPVVDGGPLLPDDELIRLRSSSADGAPDRAGRPPTFAC